MSEQEKKIGVRITCTERVTYDQQLEATEVELAELRKLLAATRQGKNVFTAEKALSEFLEDWISRDDILDSEGLEDVEVEIDGDPTP